MLFTRAAQSVSNSAQPQKGGAPLPFAGKVPAGIINGSKPLDSIPTDPALPGQRIGAGRRFPEHFDGRAAADGALGEGASLFHRYRVLHALGGGALGFSYACLDEKTGQTCAVREYFPRALAVRSPGGRALSPKDGRSGERFVCGAKAFYETYLALTAVRGGRNVLNVRDAFFENGTAYAAEDLLEGLPLSEYVFRLARPLSEGELGYLLSALADGLIVIHSLPLVHGDIRPENIFLCADGSVRLMDFGAPRFVTEGKTPPDGPETDLAGVGRALIAAFLPPDTVKNAPGRLALTANLPLPFQPVFSRLLAAGAPGGYDTAFDFFHDAGCLDVPALQPDLSALPPRELPLKDPVPADGADEPQRFRLGARIGLILAALLVLAIIALAFIR